MDCCHLVIFSGLYYAWHIWPETHVWVPRHYASSVVILDWLWWGGKGTDHWVNYRFRCKCSTNCVRGCGGKRGWRFQFWLFKASLRNVKLALLFHFWTKIVWLLPSRSLFIEDVVHALFERGSYLTSPLHVIVFLNWLEVNATSVLLITLKFQDKNASEVAGGRGW